MKTRRNRVKSLFERESGAKKVKTDAERYVQGFESSLFQLFRHLQWVLRAHAHSCNLTLDFLLPRSRQNKYST